MVLKATLAGSIDKKISSMTMILYNLGADKFEVNEHKRKTVGVQRNRRVQEITNIKGRLK